MRRCTEHASQPERAAHPRLASALAACGVVVVLLGVTGTQRAQAQVLIALIEDGSVEGRLRRADFGFVGSLEYAFSPQHGMRSFRVRAQGCLGLVDTVKDDPHAAVRNWNFMLGVDIPIGGHKRVAPPQPAPS